MFFKSKFELIFKFYYVLLLIRSRKKHSIDPGKDLPEYILIRILFIILVNGVWIDKSIKLLIMILSRFGCLKAESGLGVKKSCLDSLYIKIIRLSG